MNARFQRIETAINSHVNIFAKNTNAGMSPKAVAGLLVSALMITSIGYTAIGDLLNTTKMTNAGITGTNQTLLLVVGLMVIVSIVIKFAPKGR